MATDQEIVAAARAVDWTAVIATTVLGQRATEAGEGTPGRTERALAQLHALWEMIEPSEEVNDDLG